MAASERYSSCWMTDHDRVAGGRYSVLTSPRGEIEFRMCGSATGMWSSPRQGIGCCRDVSFRMQSGRRFAMDTELGKTTLYFAAAALLMTSARADLLDGVDIRLLALQELRKQFGIVPADPFLFSGTIESNHPRWGPELRGRMWQQALEEIGLGDFIRSLASGRERKSERARGRAIGWARQLISFRRALAHNPRVFDFGRSDIERGHEDGALIREALEPAVGAGEPGW